MATKTDTKKSPKENFGKKQLKIRHYIEFSELVRCYIMDYQIVKGAPMLRYKRVADETVHQALVDPDTKLSYLKKVLKLKNKNKGPAPWISLWKKFDVDFNDKSLIQSRIIVRSIAGTLEEALLELRNPITGQFVCSYALTGQFVSYYALCEENALKL